jgi:hypothetical protein
MHRFPLAQEDHMSMMRHTWVVGFACLCAALTVGATPAAACDPMWLPVGRTDGTSIFVALALAEAVLDTLVAAVGSRVHPLFARRLDAYTGRSRGGQRVRLLEWPDREPRQTGEAVLVPWAYREDCKPIEWATGSTGSRRARVGSSRGGSVRESIGWRACRRSTSKWPGASRSGPPMNGAGPADQGRAR